LVFDESALLEVLGILGQKRKREQGRQIHKSRRSA
jgi:hypothetical protein